MDQLALKILANATSYGIFIDLNAEDADKEDAPITLFHFPRQTARRGLEARGTGSVLSPLACHTDHRSGTTYVGAYRAACIRARSELGVL